MRPGPRVRFACARNDSTPRRGFTRLFLCEAVAFRFSRYNEPVSSSAARNHSQRSIHRFGLGALQLLLSFALACAPAVAGGGGIIGTDAGASPDAPGGFDAAPWNVDTGPFGSDASEFRNDANMMPMVCDTTVDVMATRETLQPAVFLVVDYSGSMLNEAGGQVKWTTMRDAVISITQANEARVNFGLMLFPGITRDCSLGSLHRLCTGQPGREPRAQSGRAHRARNQCAAGADEDLTERPLAHHCRRR